MYSWTRIDKFGRIARLTYFRWEVPFDRTRAKPARHRQYRSLEITPTQHPGLFSCFLLFPCARTDLRTLAQPNSVHTIQDALEHISQPRPVQVGQSSSSEASQQVLLETLPPILVFHLERFLYEGATEGMVKLGKPVQFAPELKIPLGTISLLLACASQG